MDESGYEVVIGINHAKSHCWIPRPSMYMILVTIIMESAGTSGGGRYDRV